MFFALADQKSALYKIFDLKAKDFYWIFGIEIEDRLSPFKTETLKSLKKIRFQAGSDNSFHPTHLLDGQNHILLQE